MAVRGPDRQDIWLDGPVGFGHALLHTNEGTAGQQPTSLDGQVWITADARIDARTDLVRAVERPAKPSGRRGERCSVDPARLQRVGRAMRRPPARRLRLRDLGSLGLRRLFCARDHFGVKPFYYAEAPRRHRLQQHAELHPPASRASGTALNEIAVGDFLLFGLNQDPATTTFANIRRLVAGHSLTRDERSRAHAALLDRTPPTAAFDIAAQPTTSSISEVLLRTAVADRLAAARPTSTSG